MPTVASARRGFGCSRSWSIVCRTAGADPATVPRVAAGAAASRSSPPGIADRGGRGDSDRSRGGCYVRVKAKPVSRGSRCEVEQRTDGFNTHQIGVVVTLDNEPWFVAADVCRILGLTVGSNALRPLVVDERKAREKRTTPDVALFPGAMTCVSVISESGLNKHLMHSDKPEARSLQDWVSRVVLPAKRLMAETGNSTGDTAQIARPLQPAAQIATRDSDCGGGSRSDPLRRRRRALRVLRP